MMEQADMYMAAADELTKAPPRGLLNVGSGWISEVSKAVRVVRVGFWFHKLYIGGVKQNRLDSEEAMRWSSLFVNAKTI